MEENYTSHSRSVLCKCGYYVLYNEKGIYISVPFIPERLPRLQRMCDFEGMCFTLQQNHQNMRSVMYD